MKACIPGCAPLGVSRRLVSMRCTFSFASPAIVPLLVGTTSSHTEALHVHQDMCVLLPLRGVPCVSAPLLGCCPGRTTIGRLSCCIPGVLRLVLERRKREAKANHHALPSRFARREREDNSFSPSPGATVGRTCGLDVRTSASINLVPSAECESEA